MNEAWLSIIEYARQLNMSDMTVRRRIKTGKIQAVLRDGKYYIPASEAQKKLSRNTYNHTTAERPVVNSLEPQFRENSFGQHLRPEKNSLPLSQFFSPLPEPALPKVNQASLQQRHTRDLSVSETRNVDTAALIAFCENALKKTSEAEQRLEKQYRETIARLETELTNKDLQIKSLSQQVEDLQVLTKILERKKL